VAQYEVLILGFLCGKYFWYSVVDLCALIAHRYIFLLFNFVILVNMNFECSYFFSFLLLGYSQLSGRTNLHVLNKDAEVLLNILKK
jgi:hypothetical protein